jgi:hypothetical protein
MLRHGREMMRSLVVDRACVNSPALAYLRSMYGHNRRSPKSLTPGEWSHEPDRLDFWASGFPCAIRRGNVGALCGYVGVRDDHPWVCDPDSMDVSCHGGVTFQDKANDHMEPMPVDDLTWIGFDCAHSLDLVPAMISTRTHWRGFFGSLNRNRYRNLRWVKNECQDLARQAQRAQQAVDCP